MENYKTDPFEDFYLMQKLKELKEQEKTNPGLTDSPLINEMIENAKQNSLKPSKEEYKTTRKKRQVPNKAVITCMLVAAVVVGAAIPAIKSNHKSVVNNYVYEMGAPVRDSKHFTGTDPNTGDPIFYYSVYELAQNLEAQTGLMPEEKVYYSYMSLDKVGNWEEILDIVVRTETGLTNFSEFLKANNFENVKDWEKTMFERTAYKIEQLKKSQAFLKEESSRGR